MPKRHSSARLIHSSSTSSTDRHELHRAVDGDWPREPPDPADVRVAVVVVAVATLIAVIVSVCLHLRPWSTLALVGSVP